ncbi:16S rRNA (guanine(527)-N(7))-methyltransferase RsmG [Halothiobacillus diazotrophicus]|uniref:16S rRNA (guanine(527)-N(7))-methyltransferase RsmG n=1 Tax=Halothiobacillus diazotrophicus TaxID=1860122 RepID=UPI0009EE3AD8|nr:16S rRNA (guanine(527)-N(7))-methyltransferase RsmG [Halothiobacillus diazotrophicus]
MTQVAEIGVAPALVDAIAAGARGLDQPVAPETAVQLAGYLMLLSKWNRTYNLTAVRDPADMVVRHVLDSLAVRPWVRSAGRLADVGSGPGIPGIILAIADPTLDVTLIDSNLKMTRFAETAIRTLGLPNVRVVRGRVESLPADQFDQVISRAYASTSDFLTSTAHLARPGGEWLAMKGRVDVATPETMPDKFEIREIMPLTVPGLNAERHLLIFQRETMS